MPHRLVYLNDAEELTVLERPTGEPRSLAALANGRDNAYSLLPAPGGEHLAVFVRGLDPAPAR
ncbi:MAG: hypothetical protein HC915_10705, partial [Anaerolineae bacterium]|nr:hypothetical protein [Anaerolineae bacterium]